MATINGAKRKPERGTNLHDHPHHHLWRLGHPAVAAVTQELSQAVFGPDRGDIAVSDLGPAARRPGSGAAGDPDQFRFPLHRDRATGRDRGRARRHPDRTRGPQHRARGAGRGPVAGTDRSRGADAGRPVRSRGPRRAGLSRRGPGRGPGGPRRAAGHLRHHARPVPKPATAIWNWPPIPAISPPGRAR